MLYVLRFIVILIIAFNTVCLIAWFVQTAEHIPKDKRPVGKQKFVDNPLAFIIVSRIIKYFIILNFYLELKITGDLNYEGIFFWISLCICCFYIFFCFVYNVARLSRLKKLKMEKENGTDVVNTE